MYVCVCSILTHAKDLADIDRWKKGMKHKKSKKKKERMKKKTVCFFLCLYLGLTRDSCGPSASPSSCRNGAAAVSAMLGCVLCALFQTAWLRASSLFTPTAGWQLWCAGTDWKCHIKTQWRRFYCRRDVPTEPLDTGGDAQDGNIDSYRISVPTICWHPLSPPTLILAFHSFTPLSGGPPTISPTQFIPFFIHPCILPSSLPLFLGSMQFS